MKSRHAAGKPIPSIPLENHAEQSTGPMAGEHPFGLRSYFKNPQELALMPSRPALHRGSPIDGSPKGPVDIADNDMAEALLFVTTRCPPPAKAYGTIRIEFVHCRATVVPRLPAR